MRSRDPHMVSQTSKERRTIQRAFQTPSGLSHASHSFRLGIVGLLLCAEMVKSVMMATILLLLEMRQQGRCPYVTHLREVDGQCPDDGHELLTHSVVAAVTEKRENTWNGGIKNDGLDVLMINRLLGAVRNCGGGSMIEGRVLWHGGSVQGFEHGF